MSQTPESIRAGLVCAAIGALLIAGSMTLNPDIWSARPAAALNTHTYGACNAR
ncbi:hypothetical protein [Ancylobacter sp. IITR112]|uniref:hypothetical protein n=1 Tax=Ancylobacter sp. IITR112 TaxID=3138073 RepID=UPI003529EE1C